MTQTTLRDYLQSTEDAISNGRIDEAYEHCQYMLTHFPESLEAQRLLGEVYLAQGQFSDAQQTFDWVLTNDPENVIAYCDRALISERMEDFETALDCYQQAYELSRGNSQIRQEFNTLSTKVGQQGFIFSRAGLARLYMRGDLLPQAIQEWETVLATTPDRLDARTGLLETYWREGLYDQVEPLARSILNDIPGCLKALLLLAHVTFAQNVNTSQELLQRAEALDPELTMASELFSDFMASQPHDPFLALLRKETAPSSQTPDAPVSPAAAISPFQPANGNTTSNGNGSHGSGSSYHTSEFSDSLMRWSSLDNIIEPQQEYQIMQDAAPFTAWTTEQTLNNGSNTHTKPEQPPMGEATQRNTPVLDSWGGFGQSGDNWPALDPIAPQDKTAPEPQPLTSDASQQAQHEEEPFWYSDIARATEEQKDVPLADSFSQWSSPDQLGELSTSPTWEANAKEESVPPPPPWLDVLTRSEQHQQPSTASSTSASPSFSMPEPVADNPPELTAPMDKTIQPDTLPAFHAQDEENEEPPFAFSQSEDEDFSFGPEWLKSLGARSMNSMDGIVSEPFEPDTMIPPPAPAAQTGNESLTIDQEESEQPKPVIEPVPAEAQFTDYASSSDTAEAADTTESQEPDLSFWEDMAPSPVEQPAFEPDVIEPAEAEQIAETPVAPAVAEASQANSTRQQPPSVSSWLEQAAQRLSQPEQNMLTTLEELEQDLRSQGFLPLEPGSLATFAQEPVAEPSLSSALAQLGEFEPQAPAQARTTAPLHSAEPPAQPLWTAAPEPVAQQQTTPTDADIQSVTPVQQPQQTRQQQASAMPSHLDALSSFVAQAKADKTPVAKPETKIPEQSPQLPPFVTSNSVPEQVTPAPRPEALLDMELETTMKRPAVRLQAMQPQRYGTSRGNAGERTSSGKLPPSGDLSYKERLLKGYQYQLSGAYDDAMQEYRVIIRNAPELLGEVVSNMRALLKLAPKYSAGYRVLGDAYMRQGEYLQAMEAYNKALTMAKKAKN